MSTPLPNDLLIAANRRPKERDYWTGQLRGYPERPGLLDEHGAGEADAEPGSYAFSLEPAVAGGLERLRNGSDQRLLVALAAGLAALLHRCTGARDFLLGVPIPRQEQAGAPQPLLNTLLPLGVAVRPGTGYKELVLALRERWREALAHANFPVAGWAGARESRGEPLFDTALSLENVTDGRYLTGSGAGTIFLFRRHAGGIDGELRCRGARGERVALLARRLNVFWSRLLSAPEAPIAGLDFSLPEDGPAWDALNAPPQPFPERLTLDRLFAGQAARTPHRPAVRFRDTALSYAGLDGRANHLAGALKEEYGVGPETVVAIIAQRRPATLVGLLGILKAGGAYLPLDPDEPAARLRFKLSDSGARLVLLPAPAPALDLGGLPRLDLDADTTGRGPATAPAGRVYPDNLAYVMYTSGSTGTPKGVAVGHRGVINRLDWGQRTFPLTGQDVILQKTPLTFDVSVYELFWGALAGATLHWLEPGAERDPQAVLEALITGGVTVAHFVPSMLAAFLDAVERGPGFPRRLRYVFASGEALAPDQARRFYRLFRRSGAQLVNLYGPTEASIEAACFPVPADRPVERIPLGRPIANVRLQVLDRRLARQPPGVPGELGLAGVCPARGYLNRPDLTAAAFVPDPFGDGERLYRTGDLARLGADGQMEFLGRIDHQVKIRGRRVEPGEIEHQLRACPGVRDAVVMVERREARDSLLHAYLLLEPGAAAPSAAELRAGLAGRLPDYMIPARFSRVEGWPLLGSGKLDRRRLAGQGLALASGHGGAPPRTATEEWVAAIWREVLKLERVGIDEPFFEIGGTSYAVLAVSDRLGARLNCAIPVTTLFEHTTVRALARWLDGGREDAPPAARPADESAGLGLGLLQQTLEAFDELHHEP